MPKSKSKLPEFIEKTILAGRGLINMAEEKTRELVDELVKRGEMDKKDAEGFVESILTKAEKRTKNLEKKITNLIEKALEKAHIPLKKDITKLEKKVKDLEKKITKLGKK